MAAFTQFKPVLRRQKQQGTIREELNSSFDAENLWYLINDEHQLQLSKLKNGHITVSWVFTEKLNTFFMYNSEWRYSYFVKVQRIRNSVLIT